MATVYETYAAALRNETADLPPGTARVGVVRRPFGWFHAVVDENVPALGPPADLLDAVKDRQAAFEADGLDGAAAVERAWAAVDFAARYDAYLETDPEAAAAVDRLLERVGDGTDVAVVCYEAPDKPCHRHRLRERLLERLEAGTE